MMILSFANGDGYLDIIIYIIFVVGGLAANAYRNYAKRKEQQENKSPNSFPEFPDASSDQVFDPDQSFFEEAEKDFSYEKEPEPEIGFGTPDSYEEAGTGKAEETAAYASTSELSQEEEFKNLEVSGETETKQGDADAGINGSESELYDFDVKKAVIYSEILNAKYI